MEREGPEILISKEGNEFHRQVSSQPAKRHGPSDLALAKSLPHTTIGRIFLEHLRSVLPSEMFERTYLVRAQREQITRASHSRINAAVPHVDAFRSVSIPSARAGWNRMRLFGLVGYSPPQQCTLGPLSATPSEGALPEEVGNGEFEWLSKSCFERYWFCQPSGSMVLATENQIHRAHYMGSEESQMRYFMDGYIDVDPDWLASIPHSIETHQHW